MKWSGHGMVTGGLLMAQAGRDAVGQEISTGKHEMD
jgi:hypothetical protein